MTQQGILLHLYGGAEARCAHALQIVVLLPLFLFCYAMYKWERQDLVPIRPMEGEELPLDITGPRTERQLKFVDTLKHTINIEAPPEEAL